MGVLGINFILFVLVNERLVTFSRCDYGFGWGRRGIPAVPFLGDRVAILRVHDAACGSRIELGGRRRNGWHRINAITPGVQCAGHNRWRAARGYSRHEVAVTDRKSRLKDGRVALLLHAQWAVLEGISVIYSETPAETLLPVAGQIIRKPHARAEVFVVIACLLDHPSRRQRAERGSRLEFLKGRAVGRMRSSD